MFVSTTLQIYCAYKAGLGLPLNWSPAFCLLVWFLSLIAVTICIGKDLSDIEGDRKALKLSFFKLKHNLILTKKQLKPEIAQERA
uniref:Uncharacterized protein n=1 Tax=Cannabis sativa TaxID=3483 RepID=A0A803NGD1_CANSA